jgi:hypothetical protein
MDIYKNLAMMAITPGIGMAFDHAPRWFVVSFGFFC